MTIGRLGDDIEDRLPAGLARAGAPTQREAIGAAGQGAGHQQGRPDITTGVPGLCPTAR